jgi:putative transposase
MPRKPRKILLFNECTCHKVWRGHNKEYNIKRDADKKMYLKLMREEHAREDNQISITALCLMSNHSHELNKIGKVDDYSNYLRRHHSKYGRYFNNTYNRSGSVSQGRPFTACFESEYHTLECIHYIHYNPVKARLAKSAEKYEWSTFRYYAYGEKPSWLEGINVTFPKCYEALGRTPEERQNEYLRLFKIYVSEIEGTGGSRKDDTYFDSTQKKSKPNEKNRFVGNIFIGTATWISMNRRRVYEFSKGRAGPAGDDKPKTNTPPS